jgi:glycerol-3-phosphate cytidylyltransferase
MTVIVGYTTGVFDLFHIGHLNLLRAARERCDRLIVGVATDEFASARKGGTPVIPFAERCEVVSEIKGVDHVVTYSRTDDLADWERFSFKRIFKGSDWKGHPRWAQLSHVDVEIVFLPYTESISTTLLRQRIQASLFTGARPKRELAALSGS